MKRPRRPHAGWHALAATAPALAAGIFWCLFAAGAANAQQINGVPGSPTATVTLDGKQLPPPPMKFGGVIKESAADSTPWWPPRVVPPQGAPNVLLIMTDDQGYGVPSTFGGVSRSIEEGGSAIHAEEGALKRSAKKRGVINAP